MTRRWNEREQRLEKIRAREKRLEERASKRRRVDETSSRSKPREVDEEAEFLLDSRDEGDPIRDDDPLSMFSAETRRLMEENGNGGG